MAVERRMQRFVDMVEPDVCRSGGITETFRIVQAPELFGIRYYPHFWTGGIGLAALLRLRASAEHHFYICEYDQSPNDLRNHLGSRPCDLQYGALRVPEGPALKIELDEKMLEKYSVSVEEPKLWNASVTGGLRDQGWLDDSSGKWRHSSPGDRGTANSSIAFAGEGM